MSLVLVLYYPWKSQVLCSIETLGEVDRVAQFYFRGIDLVVPDIEPTQSRGAVECGEGAFHGIESAGDVNASDAGDVEAGVVGVPAMAEIDLKVGVKIHR